MQRSRTRNMLSSLKSRIKAHPGKTGLCIISAWAMVALLLTATHSSTKDHTINSLSSQLATTKQELATTSQELKKLQDHNDAASANFNLEYAQFQSDEQQIRQLAWHLATVLQAGQSPAQLMSLRYEYARTVYLRAHHGWTDQLVPSAALGTVTDAKAQFLLVKGYAEGHPAICSIPLTSPATWMVTP